jgi:hypothetical protein
VDLLSDALRGSPEQDELCSTAYCLQLDDVWQLFARLSAEKSRALAKLFGPALQVEKSEAGGGLICWGRKKIRLPAAGD